MPAAGRPARQGISPLTAAAGILAVLVVSGLLVGGVVFLPQLINPEPTLAPTATPTAIQPVPSSDSWDAGYSAPALDPGFPQFPLPAGATLVASSVDGEGAAAYRSAGWDIALGYEDVLSFYAGLQDGRWTGGERLLVSRDLTTFTFDDSTGTYDRAELTVGRTEPASIDLKLIPSGEIAAPTFDADGTTISLGSLPSGTIVPSRIASSLVPPNSYLVDAAEVGTTASALWHSASSGPELRDFYVAQLADADPSVSDEGEVVVITFAGSMGSGTVVINSAPDGADVYLDIAQ
jgi:hypothetical protein